MANPENLRPFPKGHKFGGRKPKGSISFSTRLRNALENQTVNRYNGEGQLEKRIIYDEIIAQLCAGAINSSRKDQLGYIITILDRDQGKPNQKIEQNTTHAFDPDLSILTDEQLDAVYKNNQLGDDEPE